MAGVKISELPAVSAALLTDIFPVVQAGVTSKETVTQLFTLFNTSLTGTFLPLAGGTMSGDLILNADATLPLQAATFGQLQTIAAGFTVILACEAATTANLNATQAGAGVGATLTDNSGTFAVFGLDGVSPALNSRILVKDQTASANNGVYVLTTNGDTVSVPWQLTRATDYDQAPSEIKPGTLVVVNTGTVNATTSWLETNTIVTVDTDPILFSQFTFSPTAFLLSANNLSDLTSVPTALVNLGLGVPTGTGNVVRQTSPTLITPTLGAATATSLAFSPTTSGIIGTTAADNAGAGIVGEYISSIVAQGSAVAVVNAVAKSITSIALSAGFWLVWAEIYPLGSNPTTQITRVLGGISTINNTFPTVPSNSASFVSEVAGITTGSTQILWTSGGTGSPVIAISPCIINVNALTTVYLVALINFTVSTCGAYGKICALRMR